MRISPIDLYKNYYCKSNTKQGNFSPSFGKKSNDIHKLVLNSPQKGQIRDTRGKILNRHTTCCFRGDLDWFNLGEYLKEKFDSCDNVNTYVWGCSSGEEAYSLAITLMKFFEKPDKFFPIEAMDISSKLIEDNKLYQKTGIIISSSDYFRAKLRLSLNADEEERFFKHGLNSIGLKMLDNKVINSVNFSCSNILNDINNIDTENPSIVMARNMWPYIDPSEYHSFAKKLYKRLKKSSVFVIGGYDFEGEKGYKNSNNISKELYKAGFKQIDRARGRLYENYDDKDKPYFVYEK